MYLTFSITGFEIAFAFFFCVSTTRRPVPLEHCLFYSGELYKICENEAFLPQGLRAVKDVYKRKTSNIVGGSTTKKLGAPSSHGASQNRLRETSARGKGQKHSGPQNIAKFSGPSGAQQNSWGSSRSEISLWLLLINKLSKKSLLPVCTAHALLKESYFILIRH